MKLFVDDLRACPEGWYPARTITEAIRILDCCFDPVEEISLDHDIACRLVDGHEHSSNETFEAVARYISAREELRSNPDFKIRIHTANVAAGRRMAEILNIDYDNKIFDPKDY